MQKLFAIHGPRKTIINILKILLGRTRSLMKNAEFWFPEILFTLSVDLVYY